MRASQDMTESPQGISHGMIPWEDPPGGVPQGSSSGDPRNNFWSTFGPLLPFWHLIVCSGPTRLNRGPLPADVAAKEEFVRKCTVIYTVDEKGHLPIGALEKFCGETKDVVACRMLRGW